jgi:hypothetical protein
MPSVKHSVLRNLNTLKEKTSDEQMLSEAIGICEITSEHRSLQHSDIGNIAPAYKTPQISTTSKDL